MNSSTLHLFCAFAIAGTAYADDALLHQTTAYDQKQVSMAANAEACVAVWNSYNQDTASGGIFGTVLDLSSPGSTEEFQINQTSEGNQNQPDVALMPGGGFAACWRGPWPELDKENIILRIFDSNATPKTDDILVSTHSGGNQRHPRIAALPSGYYAVAWESHAYPERSKKAVCCRVFDANGLAASPEVLLTDQSYAARHVDIAANGLGQFVVVWLNDRTQNAVWARSFDLKGAPLTDSFQVNEDAFKTLTYPRVSAAPQGGFAVVWDGDPNAGAEDDVHIRFYDANHVSLSPDTILNASTDGAQTNPSVCVDERLCALVAWESNHLSADQGQEILTRHIDVNGLICGPETCATHTRVGDQENPSLVMTSTGQFVLAWESSAPEINNTDVHYCWGRCPSSSDLNADSHTNFQDFALFAQRRSDLSPVDTPTAPGAWTGLKTFSSEWLSRSIAPQAAKQ